MQKGLLNAEAKYMLARMGHRHMLGVTDARYNIPRQVESVDLAVLPDVPTIMQVLDGILEEIVVEQVILASEIREFAPDILAEYEKRFAGVEFVFIPHVEFDKRMLEADGVIRTGQYGKHAPNCILKVGCEY